MTVSKSMQKRAGAMLTDILPEDAWALLVELCQMKLAGPWVEFSDYSWKRFPSPRPYATQCCEVYRNTAEDGPETWYASAPNVAFRKPFTNAADAKAHVDQMMEEGGWLLA
jgi:hypothetical protein